MMFSRAKAHDHVYTCKFNTLQHTTTPCNTLQHTATPSCHAYEQFRHTVTRYNMLEHNRVTHMWDSNTRTLACRRRVIELHTHTHAHAYARTHAHTRTRTHIFTRTCSLALPLTEEIRLKIITTSKNQLVFTGVPVPFKQVFTRVPKVSNRFSRK